MVLACQVSWSQYTEAALQKSDLTAVQQVLRVVEATLNVLADSVLHEQPAVRRRKLEHLVCLLKCLLYTPQQRFPGDPKPNTLRFVIRLE